MARKIHPHKVFHWPRESGEYNFVQVQIDYREPGFREYPILAFPHNGDSHGDVLRKFLGEIHIDNFPIFRKGDDLIPAVHGREYDVVGIGRGYFDMDEPSLEVHDLPADNDYGSLGLRIGTNRKHLEEVTKHSKIQVKYR